MFSFHSSTFICGWFTNSYISILLLRSIPDLNLVVLMGGVGGLVICNKCVPNAEKGSQTDHKAGAFNDFCRENCKT